MKFIPIEYLDNEPEGISWDDRQEMGIWKLWDNEPSGSGKNFSICERNMYYKDAIEQTVRHFARLVLLNEESVRKI